MYSHVVFERMWKEVLALHVELGSRQLAARHRRQSLAASRDETLNFLHWCARSEPVACSP
jgi:hypothetical protein